MGTNGGGNSEARKRAEDVYELVEDLGADLAKVTAVMVSAGGAEMIVQRVQEHEQLMIEVPIMRATQNRIETTVDVLADHVIGEKIPDPLNPGKFLINGRGEPLRKPRSKWPRWLGEALRTSAVVLVSLLTFLATIG